MIVQHPRNARAIAPRVTARAIIIAAALAASLAPAACSPKDDAPKIHVTVHLTYPDQATADATKELLFLVREPDPASHPCADTLFDMTGTDLSAVGTIIDRPGDMSSLFAPKFDGPITLFVYTYPKALERFCSADDDCSGSKAGTKCTSIGLDRSSCSDGSTVFPTAGGCTDTTVHQGTMSEASITLTPKP